MEFQHVNVKLFVKNPERVDLEALIPVFHGWIQDQGRANSCWMSRIIATSARAREWF